MRGLAHIGVVKALTEAGIRPAVVTGTSAGSLIGAAVAAGMGWEELAERARTGERAAWRELKRLGVGAAA